MKITRETSLELGCKLLLCHYPIQKTAGCRPAMARVQCTDTNKLNTQQVDIPTLEACLFCLCSWRLVVKRMNIINGGSKKNTTWWNACKM